MEVLGRAMNVDDAVLALDALSHPIRLHAVMRLLKAGQEGLPAGQLGTMAGVRQNNMSQHLAVLARAGVVEARRDKKSVIYTAMKPRLLELAKFVKEMEDAPGLPDHSDRFPRMTPGRI